MERGEIWLVSLDPTAGHEQQGTRPVLIVTPAAFNRVTRLPVVVPVTSGGNFARTAGFAVSLDGVGIRTTGVVRCDQPRTIDMGTVAKLAMRQPFVLFKGLTFQKLCLPGAFRPGDHHNKMLRPGLCVVHASPQYL